MENKKKVQKEGLFNWSLLSSPEVEHLAITELLQDKVQNSICGAD